MAYSGLSEDQKDALEFIEFSHKLRLNFTRLLREASNYDTADGRIVRQNAIVNIANNLLGRTLYELVAEDADYYYPSEHGWHFSQIEMIFRVADTWEAVEILADLILGGWIDDQDVNRQMEKFKMPIHYRLSSGDIYVEVDDFQELKEKDQGEKSPNIKLLVERMNLAIKNQDAPAALHASASIYETLAKEVVGVASVEKETFGGFIDRYKKDSLLPEAIVDYMLEIYKKRNSEPLASHGSTQESKLSIEEAIIFSEFTKAIVKAEWALKNNSLKSHIRRK